jgi:ATP synthase F1 gamma subunit
VSREATLRAHVRSLEVLDQAVLAMKSLSAHHFRVARAALIAARTYREQLEEAVAGVCPVELQAPEAPTRLVVIGADLGLCGQYHARVVEGALGAAREVGAASVACVGKRTASLLARAGMRSDGVYGAPTSVDAAPRVLLEVIGDLIADLRAGRVGAVFVTFARFQGVGAFEPVHERLIPLPAPTGSGPPASPYVSLEHLRDVATRERLFVHLEERLLDAMASEHGMRLVATNAAGEWLDRELGTAQRRLRAQRQEAGTQEILEIVAARRSGSCLFSRS